MRYINKNTGEVRDFTCTIKSTIWEPKETKAPKILKDEITEKPVKKSIKK